MKSNSNNDIEQNSRSSSYTGTRTRNDVGDSSKKLLTLLRRQETLEASSKPTTTTTTLEATTSTIISSEASTASSTVTTIKESPKMLLANQSNTSTTIIDHKSVPSANNKGQALIKILKRNPTPIESGNSLGSSTSSSSIAVATMAGIPPIPTTVGESQPSTEAVKSIAPSNVGNKASDTFSASEKNEGETIVLKADSKSAPVVLMRRINPSILFGQTSIASTTSVANLEKTSIMIPPTQMSAAAIQFMNSPAAVEVQEGPGPDKVQESKTASSSEYTAEKIGRKLVPSVVVRKKSTK